MTSLHINFALKILLATHILVANADIYGYTDANGAVYLTDTPTQIINPAKIDTATSLGTTAKTDALSQYSYQLLAVSPPEPVSVPSATVIMDVIGPDKKTVISTKSHLYKNEVKLAALNSGIETALLHAVIMTESNYNVRAISPKGARGLMQLMPATAKRFGVKNSDDPKQNIQGGARYLSYLLKLFKNDFMLALAAYNAGENAVIEHGNKIPPYRETVHYVKKVMGIYNKQHPA